MSEPLRGEKGEPGERGEGMTRGARRAVVALFILSFVIGAANLFWTGHDVNSSSAALHREQGTLAQAVGKLQTALLASCAFAADVGSVPIPPRPVPSKLGISLVADSRAQWRELHCPGNLPAPPGFARWAAFYDLPDK